MLYISRSLSRNNINQSIKKVTKNIKPPHFKVEAALQKISNPGCLSFYNNLLRYFFIPFLKQHAVNSILNISC